MKQLSIEIVGRILNAPIAPGDSGRLSIVGISTDSRTTKAGDFVKTSTGLGPHGATVQDVELLRDCVGAHVGVKASGGIRTWADAARMINAGATRLGTSAGPAIVEDYLIATASGSRAAGRG